MSGCAGRAPGPPGGIELVLFAIVALLTGGSAVVWLAGNLAAVLAGTGPLGIGVADAARVLTRLPDTLDDPARAWPLAVRDELPGNLTITVVLILSVLVVLAVLMVLLWVLLRLQRPRQPADSADWATSRDLRDLQVSGPERGRVYRTVPSILEWDGPVLATSVKGDLAHDTIVARSKLGDTRVFDPTGATGLASAAWSPVAASCTWEGARRTAARLLELGRDDGHGADQRFWRPAAARYLAPLLFAASRAQLTMGDVLEWIATT